MPRVVSAMLIFIYQFAAKCLSDPYAVKTAAPGFMAREVKIAHLFPSPDNPETAETVPSPEVVGQICVKPSHASTRRNQVQS